MAGKLNSHSCGDGFRLAGCFSGVCRQAVRRGHGVEEGELGGQRFPTSQIKMATVTENIKKLSIQCVTDGIESPLNICARCPSHMWCDSFFKSGSLRCWNYQVNHNLSRKAA